MIQFVSFLLVCSLFGYAQCSPAAPEITAPAILRRTLDNDPAFRGYTSTLGSWSPLYCNGDYTYSDFGNIADCCTTGGICHPATDCSADFEGSTRVILYQGGDALTCLDTTCGTQTVYKTSGDPNPVSIYGCFTAGDLYLTTPGEKAAAAASTTTSPSGAAQTSQSTDSSAATSPADVASSSSQPTKHTALIAGGAAVGVVLLLAIAGLIAWIIILKRRNSKGKPSPNTELQKIQANGGSQGDAPPGGFKAELPTKEGWASELSPESAPVSRQEQKPWSNLNAVPQSPASNYSPAPPYTGVVSPLTPASGGGNPVPYYPGHNGQLAEAPDAGIYHQELPASTRPQYAELG